MEEMLNNKCQRSCTCSLQFKALQTQKKGVSISNLLDGLSAGCSIKNAKKQNTKYKNVRRKTYIAHKQCVKVKLLNLINVIYFFLL